MTTTTQVDQRRKDRLVKQWRDRNNRSCLGEVVGRNVFGFGFSAGEHLGRQKGIDDGVKMPSSKSGGEPSNTLSYVDQSESVLGSKVSFAQSHSCSHSPSECGVEVYA